MTRSQAIRGGETHLHLSLVANLFELIKVELYQQHVFFILIIPNLNKSFFLGCTNTIGFDLFQ